MRILFLVTGFPSDAHPTSGIFNMRAYSLLSKEHEVQLIKLKSFIPFRSTKNRECIDKYEYISWNIVSGKILERAGVKWFWLEYLIIRSYLNTSDFRLGEFDIIHSVGLSGAATVGSILAEKYSIPHICQAIGTDVNSLLPKYSKSRLSYFKKYISGFGANSKSLNTALRFFFPNKRIDTIYRGVDLGKFHLCKKNHSQILFLGGLVSDDYLKIQDNLKGGVDVLRLWKQDEKMFSERGINLIFAGPNSLNTAVQEWYASLMYRENVTLAGIISHDKVNSLLQSSEIVLIPSKAEGLPNVALEAMASGCVVVGTRVGGLPEIIENGISGFLLNPSEFINKAPALIFDLLSSPAKTNRIKMKAREVVTLYFNQKNFVEGYSYLYKEITKE